MFRLWVLLHAKRCLQPTAPHAPLATDRYLPAVARSSYALCLDSKPHQEDCPRINVLARVRTISRRQLSLDQGPLTVGRPSEFRLNSRKIGLERAATAISTAVPQITFFGVEVIQARIVVTNRTVSRHAVSSRPRVVGGTVMI